MVEKPGDEGDLTEGIISIRSYEAPRPPKKEFLPWHRPRKQYVRHAQWCGEIEKLVTESPREDGKLKYLGLPGVDLLDLRYFHSQVCEPKGLQLRFLGFNSGAQPNSNLQAELNISLDEVRRLPYVDEMSDVIGDNFSLVATEKSIAAKRAHQLGPFDIINLDLCDGFGAQAPGVLQNTYYDAVHRLFALQSRSKMPWLLLLTTRTDQPNIDQKVLARLIEKYVDNLKKCVSFLKASKEEFSIETEAAVSSAVGTPPGLCSIFVTGICKWLVGLALAHKPQLNVELRSAIGYRVATEATHEDLVSLALRFSPTIAPASDPMKLAKEAAQLDECKICTSLVARIAKRVDVDKRLKDNATLHSEMVDASAKLLSEARYDADEYRKWVAT